MARTASASKPSAKTRVNNAIPHVDQEPSTWSQLNEMRREIAEQMNINIKSVCRMVLALVAGSGVFWLVDQTFGWLIAGMASLPAAGFLGFIVAVIGVVTAFVASWYAYAFTRRVFNAIVDGDTPTWGDIKGFFVRSPATVQ